jgi:RNA polymerase sigma-70 factor, ECF subfamily
MRLPMTATALEAVWREMHAPLLRYIARRVSDPSDAEDVLQDVMLRIQRQGRDLDHVDQLGAWLQQVTRSAVIDFYRRRAARPEQAAGTGDDVGDSEIAPAEDSTPTELARCLRPLLARLPDKYAEALELTEFDGLSQVAAAERLGLSTSGMKARVQRARAQLRDLLLECCDVELDSRGGVVDYHTRAGGCGRCDTSAPAPHTQPV